MGTKSEAIEAVAGKTTKSIDRQTGWLESLMVFGSSVSVVGARYVVNTSASSYFLKQKAIITTTVATKRYGQVNVLRPHRSRDQHFDLETKILVSRVCSRSRSQSRRFGLD